MSLCSGVFRTSMLNHVMLCLLCYVMLILLYYFMLCYVMLCHVMLYVMVYYTISYYVMLVTICNYCVILYNSIVGKHRNMFLNSLNPCSQNPTAVERHQGITLRHAAQCNITNNTVP